MLYWFTESIQDKRDLHSVRAATMAGNEMISFTLDHQSWCKLSPCTKSLSLWLINHCVHHLGPYFNIFKTNYMCFYLLYLFVLCIILYCKWHGPTTEKWAPVPWHLPTHHRPGSGWPDWRTPEALQHTSPLGQYYTSSLLLNFGGRKRSGVFRRIWPSATILAKVWKQSLWFSWWQEGNEKKRM